MFLRLAVWQVLKLGEYRRHPSPALTRLFTTASPDTTPTRPPTPALLALHRLNSVIYFSLTLINKPVSTSALLNTQTLLSARTQHTLFCLTIRPHTHTRPHPVPQITFQKKGLHMTIARRNTGETTSFSLGRNCGLPNTKGANADI